MSDLCNDNRFELIEKYKKELIEATNIETAPDEMAVLDNILFRFWQMGWLDKLELPPAQPERKKGKWRIYVDCEGKTRRCTCSMCGHKTDEYCWKSPNYCENCGAEMEDGEEEDEEEDWEEDDWDE